MAKPRKSYTIGYKKPPTTTQFPPGQSGNPKGRPKGTKNLQTDLQEEFQEDIQIYAGGKTTVISKQRALIKRLMEKGLKGEDRATEILLKWYAATSRADEGSESTASLPEEDEAILAWFHTQGASDKSQPCSKKGTE